MEHEELTGFILVGPFGQGLGDGTHVVCDILPAVQEDHSNVPVQLQENQYLRTDEDKLGENHRAP